jgi:hypothetical protein
MVVVLENLVAVVVEVGVRLLFLQIMDQILRDGQTTILVVLAIRLDLEETMHLLKSS